MDSFFSSFLLKILNKLGGFEQPFPLMSSDIYMKTCTGAAEEIFIFIFIE